MLKIGVMLGDDIGLEVVPDTVKVMKAAAAATGLEVEWQELEEPGTSGMGSAVTAAIGKG